MNFVELVAEVQKIVKRPDKLSLIESAIRASTLKAHSSDFYYRDIVESGVQVIPGGFEVKFNPREVFPRHRKPRYVRYWKYDPNDTKHQGRPGGFYEFIEPDAVLDGYGYNRNNIAYLAGDNVIVRSNVEVTHLLYGAYVYPLITPDSDYKSWIADDYPWTIIHDAARAVFIATGDLESARGQETFYSEWLRVMRVNSVDDVGS